MSETRAQDLFVRDRALETGNQLAFLENEAKLNRAEFLENTAKQMFNSLQIGSEHYGSRYTQVLNDLALAYRLAYESSSSPNERHKADAQRVTRSIEMFCQRNQWTLFKESVQLPGLITTKVRIETEKK